jgi:protein pelota
MRIIKLDADKRKVWLVPENAEDMLFLERFIEPGDRISGVASRKVRQEEHGKSERQPIYVTVIVDQTEFKPENMTLRIAGKVCECKPQGVAPLGSLQTINLSRGQRIVLEKTEMHSIHVKQLRRMQHGREPILVVVLDDELATVAELRATHLVKVAEFRSKKHGKRFESSPWKKDFFQRIADVVRKSSARKLVIAGPGFIKEEFADFVRGYFNGHILVESTSCVGVTGLNELMKDRRITELLRDVELIEHEKRMEELFKYIAQGSGRALYGLSDVERAAELGAVETLLVLEELIFKEKAKIAELVESVEHARGRVYVLSSKSNAGKLLQGLGGIAAILRFSINQ